MKDVCKVICVKLGISHICLHLQQVQHLLCVLF